MKKYRNELSFSFPEKKRPIVARLHHFHQALDLALFRVADTEKYKVPQLGDESSLTLGNQVHFFSPDLKSAIGEFYLRSSSITWEKERGIRGTMRFQETVGPGHSGGPVLDCNGKIMGLISQSSLTGTIIIPASVLLTYLQSNQLSEPDMQEWPPRAKFAVNHEVKGLDRKNRPIRIAISPFKKI